MDGSQHQSRDDSPSVIVVGAGIAGLAATLRLAAIGLDVTLLERHAHLGGKIRTIPSEAGPIDAGPTVLTMRHVFDDLFNNAGEVLEDHVTLIQQDRIARHFWPDGSQLDLYADPEQSFEAIRQFSGKRSAEQFAAFDKRARQLFEAFDVPMMQAATPKFSTLTARVLRQPELIPIMAPFATLKSLLASSFSDLRLRQLFGRYATYVGGAPGRAPGILALIWHAEAQGVWVVDGGIHVLAEAIAKLAISRGAKIETQAHVHRIEPAPGGTFTVDLGGRTLTSDAIVFAGDPRALAQGALGESLNATAPHVLETPRSFSARVHSFAAKPAGIDLAHHNVFFDADPDQEFFDLMADKLPTCPSLYVCAMDRGLGKPVPDLERFEIITNAPACPGRLEDKEEWHPKIMQTMAGFGLTFQPTPSPITVTTETDFAQMFPESLGALYGSSPHGLTSSLRRPTARTHLPGFYLAGGGCHPGAGVPMAATSGRHAVEAILNDRILASAFHQTVTPGGT